jgi:hypothetical protein
MTLSLAQRRARLLAPVARWGFVKKFTLVHGIRRGVISMAEAKAAHALSEDELICWFKDADEHGARGLKVTRKRGEGTYA